MAISVLGYAELKKVVFTKVCMSVYKYINPEPSLESKPVKLFWKNYTEHIFCVIHYAGVIVLNDV